MYRKLFNAEFYKLKKSLHFKLLCIGVVVYGMIELLAVYSYDTVNGYTALMETYINWEIPYLFCGLFAAFYISGDIEKGGVQEELLAGYNKKSICFVKNVVFFVASAFIVAFYQMIPTMLFTILNGFTEGSIQGLWRGILCIEGFYLLLLASCIEVCHLFAVFFCKIYSSIISEVFFILVFLGAVVRAASKYEWIRMIYQLLPFHKFGLIIQNIIQNSIIGENNMQYSKLTGGFGIINYIESICFSSGAMFLITGVLSYIIFVRFERNR